MVETAWVFIVKGANTPQHVPSTTLMHGENVPVVRCIDHYRGEHVFWHVTAIIGVLIVAVGVIKPNTKHE